MNDTKSKVYIKRLIIDLVLSGILALVVSVVFTARIWQVNNIKNNLQMMNKWLCFNRAYILFFLFIFIGFHFIFPVKKMYQWIFDKRWLLGIILLAFLTLNKYHGDSIESYNVIQSGEENQASKPIFGETRAIRSDEWLVTTPSILASGYGENAYGKYNSIQRGTDTLNIINGVYIGFNTIAYCPWELSYAILPVEYAFSFCWFAPLIFSFLMMLELFYVITKKDKLLAAAGASLVVLSSFYMWWGFSSYYFSAPGTVVCIYYFLHSKSTWKKIAYSGGMAVCFGNFVTNLYPAWQVPLGYIFLAIGIWLLHENWDKIKELRIKDWIILGCGILLCLSFIVSYLLLISEYINSINATVYPGHREDDGGLFISKLFYYIQAPFYAFKDIGNASEAGVFFSLFPIPTIVSCYCWIKERKKDWLTGGLLLVQIPMLMYITIGMPAIVAKITLYSRSTVMRTADMVGLIQIFLIVILLSRYRECNKFPKLLAWGVGIGVVAICCWITSTQYPEYMNIVAKGVMMLIILLFAVGLMINCSRRIQEYIMIGLIGISIITSAYVRPVMKGLSAIYFKPAAKEIQQINEEKNNPKWLANGFVQAQYIVACGASAVNSVNTYPNMELWKKLDSTGKYEEIYNRYAHIDLDLTEEETSFECIAGDHIILHLSYKDIPKTEVTEFFALGNFEYNADNGYVEFEKEYEENGVTIYHLSY